MSVRYQSVDRRHNHLHLKNLRINVIHDIIAVPCHIREKKSPLRLYTIDNYHFLHKTQEQINPKKHMLYLCNCLWGVREEGYQVHIRVCVCVCVCIQRLSPTIYYIYQLSFTTCLSENNNNNKKENKNKDCVPEGDPRCFNILCSWVLCKEYISLGIGDISIQSSNTLYVSLRPFLRGFSPCPANFEIDVGKLV